MNPTLKFRWQLWKRNRHWRQRGFRLTLQKKKAGDRIPVAFWRYINHIHVEGPEGWTWVKTVLGSVAQFDSLADAFAAAWMQAKGFREAARDEARNEELRQTELEVRDGCDLCTSDVERKAEEAQ